MKTIEARLRRNAVPCLALFVALGGTAWAVGKIGSGDIAKNAIRSKHIKAEQVRPADTGPGVLDACSRGTIAAAVEVDGSASFPSTFTSEGVTGFACKGEPQARRVATGVYRIYLARVPGSVTDIAIANSVHQAGITPGEDNFTTVRRLGSSSDCDGSQVEVRTIDEGGNETLDTQDGEFVVQIAIG